MGILVIGGYFAIGFRILSLRCVEVGVGPMSHIGFLPEFFVWFTISILCDVSMVSYQIREVDRKS